MPKNESFLNGAMCFPQRVDLLWEVISHLADFFRKTEMPSTHQEGEKKKKEGNKK